jgi:hypothetical protein
VESANYKKNTFKTIIRLIIIPAFCRTDGNDIPYGESRTNIERRQQEKYLKQSEQEREPRQCMQQQNVQVNATYH